MEFCSFLLILPSYFNVASSLLSELIRNESGDWIHKLLYF
jgi:hypothetical protein